MKQISWQDKKKAITIDCNNYFNPEGFERLCDAIDSGALVHCYISCIGFTRAHREGYNYYEALKKKYGASVIYYIYEETYYNKYYFKLK